jgi:mannosyltransferase
MTDRADATSVDNGGRREALGPWLIVGALTLAAFGLRLPGMGQSLAGDEFYTFDIVRQSNLADVLKAVHDTSITPPLHYVIAWVAVKLGDPTLWVRVPSLLAGTATVPVVYLLGRRTVGVAAGLAAAAIAALSPFAIFYADEARTYAVLVLLVALSTLLLLAALESRRRALWAAFAACSCAALYAHYTAVFPLAAQLGWALWAHRERTRHVLAAYAAVGIGYLPWLPSFLHQRHNSGIKAIEAFAPFTPRTVGESIAKLVPGHPFVGFGEVPGRVALALLLLGLGAAAVAAMARPRRAPSPTVILVAALALATPVGVLLYSAVGSSIVDARNLLPSFPALCLLAGLLIASGPRMTRLAAVALVLAGLLIGAVRSLGPDSRRPPFKDVAEMIDRRAGPADAVVELQAFRVRSPVGRRPLLSGLKPYLDARARLHVALSRDRRVWTAVAGSRRVYVVIGQLPGVDRAPPPPRLDARFRYLGRRSYRGFARVVVYVYASGTTRST